MKKLITLLLAFSIMISCISMVSFVANAEETSVVEIFNGDVESGTDGWYVFRGGNYEVVQPGADGTGNCMYYQPQQRWSTIGFDLGPVIIQDEELGYFGHGAGKYSVTFKAKTDTVVDGYFTMILQSLNHLWGDEVADIIGINEIKYDNKTFVYAGDIPEWREVPIILNNEWTEYTVNFNVTQEWLDIIKALRHTPENNPEYEQTYNLVLRFDGSADIYLKELINYYVDDVTVTYFRNTDIPSPTVEILPEVTATPEPTIEITPVVTATPVPTIEATPTPPMVWSETLYIDFESQKDIDDNFMLQNSYYNKSGKLEIVNDGYLGNGAQYSEGTAAWHAPSLNADATEIGFSEPGTYRVEFYINYKTIARQPDISLILRHADDTLENDSNHSFRYLSTNLSYNLEDGDYMKENKWYLISTEFTLTNSDFEANIANQRTRFCLDEVGHTGNVFVIDELKVYKRDIAKGTISGATVEIGETLTINYFVDANFADGKIKFTSDSGKTTIVDAVFDKKTGFYKFAYEGINPQCMNDKIKAELMCNNSVLATKEEYSVKTYCENQAKKTAQQLGLTGVQHHAFKTLLADMLAYGSASQEYRNYNVSNLPDGDDWVQGYKSIFTVPTGVRKITGNTDADNKATSVGLNMANVNRIYFKLKLTDDVIVKLNGVEVDKATLIENVDGTYTLYSSDIKATQFDDVFTLTIIKDGVEITKVEYNVNAYIQGKYTNADVAKIVKALSNYGKSATAYVDALKNVNTDNNFNLEEDIL